MKTNEKQKMKCNLVILFSFMVSVGLFSQPTNNPYKTKYGVTSVHWTDEYKWNAIFNVTTYGAVANDGNDDLVAVNSAITAANAAGGGVVYFPAGTYNLSNDILLKENVVLRGADFANYDAKNSSFAPVSKLEFPKYEPLLSGNGTPITTAFKKISAARGTSSVGVVNLDVNRASIHFHPNFTLIDNTSGDGTVPNYQPVEKNRNCIVMGVRSNNAATPDPVVPTLNQLPWERICWRFSANFDLYFAENIIVDNCRLNDKSKDGTDDSYDQPGYKFDSSTAGYISDGKYARFDYANHYGLSINRAKIITYEPAAIQPFKNYPNPWDEPGLFAPGVEIVDNYVFKTMRIGITASGNGLKIINNLVDDKDGKLQELTSAGNKKNTNFSATYENRGIDFSGWNVKVIGNNVTVYNTGFVGSSYRSICGEGIMNQGNSGGSKVNGLLIKDNTVYTMNGNATNPCFSLYKTKEIYNVKIINNICSGPNGYMMVKADQTGGANVLQNAVVENNTVGKIDIFGSSAGQNNFVRNNTFNGKASYGQVNDSKIASSCNVVLSNNTNFDISTACAGTPLTLPETVMTYPTKDTTVAGNLISIDLRVDCAGATSVEFWGGTTLIGTVTPSGGKAVITYNFTGTQRELLVSAKGINGSLYNYSPPITISRTDANINTGLKKLENRLSVYPNPVKDMLHTSINENVEVNIYNLQGQVSKTLHLNGLEINVSDIQPGTYIVEIIKSNGMKLRSVINKK